MKISFREPLNTLTHLIGLILSLVGFFFLYPLAKNHANDWAILSIWVFSLGLAGLYFASTYYHGKMASDEVLVKLRKLDHVMIFFLIAATYTPVCLLVLPPQLGMKLLGVIWVLALSGMILKMFFINTPRWLSTGLYLFLGWASVSVIKPLFIRLSGLEFSLLVLGGLFYTVGAVIYGRKNPKLRVGAFGYHEIFHLFILAGSLSHYLMVYGILQKN